MIQSMTGYGAEQHVEEGVTYALEIRSLNNRYLKLSIKLPDSLQFLESEVDRLLRQRLVRGSVTFTLRIRREGEAGCRPINSAAMQRYVEQISAVRVPTHVQATLDLAVVASLPGVCEPRELDDAVKQEQWKSLEVLAGRAIDALIEMRRKEGEALHADLLSCSGAIRSELDCVSRRAPGTIEEYHERLRTRVDTLMKKGGFELEAEGLMREVAIYAERCDISEEVARLRSHLDQFVELCDRGERVGRTLDFLSQEMLREANTIASKCNDATIARSVVEIKGSIDRLKEQAQNVE